MEKSRIHFALAAIIALELLALATPKAAPIVQAGEELFFAMPSPSPFPNPFESPAYCLCFNDTEVNMSDFISETWTNHSNLTGVIMGWNNTGGASCPQRVMDLNETFTCTIFVPMNWLEEVPTPTPEPSPSPSPTPTPEPSPTPSPEPSPTPSPSTTPSPGIGNTQ